MKFSKISAAVAMGTLAAISMQAQGADTGTASVNAIAGLAPVITISCTDVNFGVWRIPSRSSGGATTITLTTATNTAAAATTAAATGNTTSVALASGFVAPTAATCSVSGIMNKSATVQTSIASNTGLTFATSNHESLAHPTALADLRANLSLEGTGVVIDASGVGAFRVGGVLTIPNVIDASHYGGYKTNGVNAALVTVTDQI
jgi:hypothetical protein